MKLNKKITVRSELGDIRYCILDPDVSYNEQLDKVAGFSGHGLCVRFYEDRLEFVDYFHDSAMACFPILSIEDTELPVSLKWTTL